MKLNDLTLRALTLGCTALVSMPAARAADFTVSNGQTVTSTQTVSDGGTGTVAEGGTINVIGGNAVETSGGTSADPNLVLIYGNVWTNTGMGVRLFEYSNLYLEGTGTISTAGGSAYGVGALGHTGLLIDGSISTTGTYAYGIYATDVASLDEQISVLVSG